MREGFEEVGSDFIHARARPFEGDALGHLVRQSLPQQIRIMLTEGFPDIIVRGSVGQGTWASVPWIAFFDPLITTTATQGYYVVYLFDAGMQTLYLSLNQGTTAVYQEFGSSIGRKILRDRAKIMSLRLDRYVGRFDVSTIDLHSDNDLPKGYEAGQALGMCYNLAALPPDEVLLADLFELLGAYSDLTVQGGFSPTEDIVDIAQADTVEEARILALSLKIERVPNTRKKVLKHKAAICEGCGLDPKKHYFLPDNLSPLRSLLEVHHRIPLHTLAPGERFRYIVPDDFAVLCATCHRVIHLQEDPSDIEELKKNVRFRIMEEVPGL